MPALRPDVAIIHAQRADRAGNVQLWGITGVQKEAVLAADRALVTVEEIVDELEPVPGQVVLPGLGGDRGGRGARRRAPVVRAWATATRDNDCYRGWDDDQPRPRRVHATGWREHVQAEPHDRVTADRTR